MHNSGVGKRKVAKARIKAETQGFLGSVVCASKGVGHVLTAEEPQVMRQVNNSGLD